MLQSQEDDLNCELRCGAYQLSRVEYSPPVPTRREYSEVEMEGTIQIPDYRDPLDGLNKPETGKYCQEQT